GPCATQDANSHRRSLAHPLPHPPRSADRRDYDHCLGLRDGKNIVITGVLTDASLAFGVAALAIEEGADVVLTGAGRALSLTERVARKLPKAVEALELDVTVPEHLPGVRSALHG